MISTLETARPPAATSAAGRAVRALRWLPAATAVAYVTTVAIHYGGLVRDAAWDTDWSAPLTLAERLRGSGAVFLPHFGAWTTYGWLVATRGLPGHRALWEASGYVGAVVAAALVAWATARVANRWAGVTAGATALLVGPFALRGVISVIFHVTNPIAAAALGAYVVLLARTRSWALAVAIGVLAGTNAASDPLLWFAGVAPFALAAGLLARLLRSSAVAWRAGVALAVTVLSAIGTSVLMHGLGYRVVGLERSLAPLHAIPGNVEQLVRMAALLGGANFAYPPGYPREPWRAVVAVVVLLGAVTPLAAAVRLWLRRATPDARAFATFWAAAVVALSAVFVLTPNARDVGPNSVYYILTFALAAGVGIALLAGHSRRAQAAVGIAVASIGATNIAGIFAGRVAGSPALATYERPLVQLLEQKGISRGYAGYWDAQNLSWQTHMHLLVAPVSRCTQTQLCPFDFFTIRSWYEPHRGPSFLLLNATNNAVAGAPPFARDATSTVRLGPLTLYTFDYDIARHIRLEAD